MDLGIAKSVIAVIKQEARRRDEAARDPYFAYEQQLADRSFINELCLIFLVALRHQLERELVNLAALAGHGGRDLTPAEYKTNMDELRPLRGHGRVTQWNRVDQLLLLPTRRPQSMEALRLLANAYKHDPHTQPDDSLINCLGLKTNLNYAELPESDALREGLAICVGLNKDSDYSTIAERFVESVQLFLDDIKQNEILSRVEWGPVSLNPDDSLR